MYASRIHRTAREGGIVAEIRVSNAKSKPKSRKTGLAGLLLADLVE